METTKIWVSASVIHSEASPSNFQGSQITAADPETNRLLLLQYNKSELYFELLNWHPIRVSTTRVSFAHKATDANLAQSDREMMLAAATALTNLTPLTANNPPPTETAGPRTTSCSSRPQSGAESTIEN
jgi:hypothetical protein